VIEIDKNIDWVKIRNEYLSGNISQRKLAEKYGVSEGKLLRIANRENWKALRDDTRNKILTSSQQIIVDANSQNAAIAERIKRKLLLQLEREIDALPEQIGSEKSTTTTKYFDDGKEVNTSSFKLKDYISAYQALVDDDIKRERLKIEKQKAEANDW